MFQGTSYLFIVLSISAGLLSLLGSVGIFVSLIIQRRVERLQDILEELIEQSFHEDENLTSKISRLIQKYQSHYLLPDQPTKTVLRYVDLTIALVVATWALLHLLIFSPPFALPEIIFLVPLTAGTVVLYLFRILLKNAINPLNNPLLNGIIPPPASLRSISFLSTYVNVSVKSLLKQARFVLLINRPEHERPAAVVLKEELSFDDFFYFIQIAAGDRIFFAGFGRIEFDFAPDSITRKPVPLKHNINIPLGYCSWPGSTGLTAEMLLFPMGEKHPIQHTFELVNEEDYCISVSSSVNINHGVVFSASDDRVRIIENTSDFEELNRFKEHFSDEKVRRYVCISGMQGGEELKTCSDEAYVT